MIKDRKILIVSGIDSESFLQQILTNNIKLIKDDLQYNLILTPQGKLLHDLFVSRKRNSEGCFILDCHSKGIEDIINLFQKYKLGSKVDLTIDDNINVYWSEIHSENSYKDPRHEKLGFRTYVSEILTNNYQSFDQIHYDLSLPQLYIDFESGKYFPFDVGFDQFNSISYDKGCYIGQEVITRTHFRGVVRKKVYKVKINGEIQKPLDLEIFIEDKRVGTLIGIYGNNNHKVMGLALITADLINDHKNAVIGNDKIPCEIL